MFDETLLRRLLPAHIINVDTELKETAAEAYWQPALQALREAVEEAIEEHCRAGEPLVFWRDGKVFLQAPEEARRELLAEKAAEKSYRAPEVA